MRTFIIIATLALAIGCAAKDDASTGSAAQAIEVVCDLPNDKDGDGFLDTIDVSINDSHLSDPYGFELNDHTTGAGDGIPDCE
jgi:hypothetical protein